MPIIVTSNSFTDVFGTSTTYLKNNVGDPSVGTINITESITANSSLSDSFLNNPTTDVMTWLGGDWEEEGFRVGDTIDISTYTIATSIVIASTSTTIEWINGDEMKVASALSSWYDQNNGEAVIIQNQRNREGMTLDFNMVGNGSAGSPYSLIDGEVTRFTFDMTGSSPYIGVQVGNKSGAFRTSALLTLSSSAGYTKYYSLQIEFTQDGLYNSDLYNFSNCLKLYAKMNWSSLLGEPFGQTEIVFNEDADSGWFNQAFNTGVIDATLVQSVSSLAYDQPTSGQFVIDSSSTSFAIGSAYVSGLDSYYKVQPETQTKLSMMIATRVPVIGTAYNSAINPDGANYTLEVTGITTVGTQQTIDFTFTPNTQFTTFMEAQADGNRTFYMWMRYGNVNVLVFSGQMTKQPVSALPIVLVASDFFDHSENITNGSAVETTYQGNVEDDFAWVGKFSWDVNANITNFVVGIEAYNSVSGEKFTLTQNSFNLDNVPKDSTSLQAYILNETQPVNVTLPTTSKKREIILIRDFSFDTSVDYGVRLYYPYIYRWEYWLSQINADSDFYPNEQTKNWVPYGNTGNWGLRIFLKYDRDLQPFEVTRDIVIKNYDTDSNITQDVQLWRVSPSTQVQVIIEGEQMRIVALNTIVNGDEWDVSSTWGMITIEPTESSPRWICSTAIDYDGDLSNPLTPLSGLRCDLTFPSVSVARLECNLDPNKIDLTNGVKITAKIKGCHW